MRCLRVIVVLLVFLPAGCVASVNPLVADDDDAIVVNEELVGTWMNDYQIDGKPASWIKVSLPHGSSTYDVQTLSPEGKKAFSARLVQLGDVRILDFVQTPPVDSELLGLHQFFRLSHSEDVLKVHPIDGKRFREIVKSTEPKLAIGDAGELDWSTEQLQDFFKRHASSVFASSATSFTRFRADK